MSPDSKIINWIMHFEYLQIKRLKQSMIKSSLCILLAISLISKSNIGYDKLLLNWTVYAVWTWTLKCGQLTCLKRGKHELETWRAFLINNDIYILMIVVFRFILFLKFESDIMGWWTVLVMTQHLTKVVTKSIRILQWFPKSHICWLCSQHLIGDKKKNISKSNRLTRLGTLT